MLGADLYAPVTIYKESKCDFQFSSLSNVIPNNMACCFYSMVLFPIFNLGISSVGSFP